MSVEPEANQGPRIRIGELSRRTRRRRGHAACLGAPLRGVGADPIGRGVPPLRTGRRGPGSPHERADRVRALGGPGRRRGACGGAARAPQGALDGDEANRLVDALVRLDEASAEAVLDRVFATLSLNRPAASCCRRCARSGSAGSAVRWTIAEEHFASNLIRARLLSLSRGWGGGGSSQRARLPAR